LRLRAAIVGAIADRDFVICGTAIATGVRSYAKKARFFTASCVFRRGFIPLRTLAPQRLHRELVAGLEPGECRQIA
jgi:hypothetical protein